MVSEKFKILGKLAHGMKDKEMPVLVGGGAVELYTRGYFTTGDLDILTSRAFKKKLVESGFESLGRIFTRNDMVIDVVGSYTKLRTNVVKIRRTPYKLRVLSIEDLIIDRLCACEFWKSPRDCEQARFLLNVYYDRLDSKYLKKRADEEGVVKKLEKLSSIPKNHKHL